MIAAQATPAELVAECLDGGVRRLLGGAHSLTSARAVVVRVDPQWVWVKFSTEPGRLAAPWEFVDAGWVRAPRGAEPGLRDASADPVLVVLGVGESELLAVNALAIDEIGVTCTGGDAMVAHWAMQAAVQGVVADDAAIAGARVSASPDATVVIADPLLADDPGWVDVLAAGTAWPVRPLRRPVLALPDGTPGIERGAVETDPIDSNSPSVGVADSSGQIAGEGVAVESTGLVVDPVDVASTLDAAATEPPATADPAIAADDIAAGRAGADLGPATGNLVAPDRPQGPWLTVFGGFEVVDGTGAPFQPMQQQIIGAIAFCQPIVTADLCEMLFGDPVRPKSFHVALSKIRNRGLDPRYTDAGYVLEINSEWRQFVELVGEDPATASTDALASAAAMVSAPLFGAQPPRWAAAHVTEMTSVVCRVCRELAARHCEDPAAALRYARLGLVFDPGHGELGRMVELLTQGAGGVPDRGIVS